MSVSGRIKSAVKAELPKAARAPSSAKRSAFKGEKTDDLDQKIMEINSNLNEAKINSNIPPIHLDRDDGDSVFFTRSPSVYDGLVSGTKSVQSSSAILRYSVPKSAKGERKQNTETDFEKPLVQFGSPKPAKANLTSAAIYQPDVEKRAKNPVVKNNFFAKNQPEKLQVSGVDSIPGQAVSTSERQPNESTVKKDVASRVPSYPGQFYADDRLKKLRQDFLRKDIPILENSEFLRKEPSKAEQILQQNIADLLEQHDNDRGGGDHGPCYVPGQLLEKFPFPKKGTLKKDHGPIDFNEAKPIFGDANVPTEAFNPKGLPRDLTTNYRVS
jgi:hypothetical protein